MADELTEYVAPIATSTAEMVAIVDALKDALLAALTNDADYMAVITGANETREMLIRDTYRVGLMPFMQSPAVEEGEEGEGEEDVASDMGDLAGARRGRR